MKAATVTSLLSTAAAALVSRHGSDSPSVSTVYQFSTVGTWLENLAVRSNGQILTTRLDVPEVWTVDPKFGQGSKLVSAPSVLGLLGITEIRDDIFILVGGNFSVATGTFQDPSSFMVFELDLTKGSGGYNPKPVLSTLAGIPEAGLLNGITPLNGDSVLISDSIAGVVYVMDTATGNYNVAIQDPTFNGTASNSIGVNGIRVVNGYLYYASYAQGLFCRIPIDETTGAATGDAEIIASGFPMDDFVFTADDNAVYVATNPANTVEKIALDGTITHIAGAADSPELAGATAAQWGRGKKDSGVLYVSTGVGRINGTATEPAKIAAITF